MTIGQTIKNLRKAKGLKLKHIAESANTNISRLSDIEKDKVDIRYSQLEEIAFALEIPISTIILYSESDGRVDKDVISSYVRKLI